MATATLTPLPASVRLMTVEEYVALPDDGRLTELVRGRIVEMPSPKPAHGYVCVNVSSVLRSHVRSRKLGRVVSNDSGVITERDPDSMRGPDVAFYSFDVVPEGPVNQEENETAHHQHDQNRADDDGHIVDQGSRRAVGVVGQEWNPLEVPLSYCRNA